MLGQHRKARVLFAASDIILATLAFEIAYRIRFAQHWHFEFYLTVQQKALLLGFSLFASVTIGLWLKVYEKLDPGSPGAILRDSIRQSAYSALCLLVFEYGLRMELSRFFMALYCFFSWAFLLGFRLAAGRVIGVIRREFGTPLFVMIVGAGDRAIRIAKALEQSIDYGVRLRGFFDESGSNRHEIALGSVYKVYPIAELQPMLDGQVVDEIVFAVDSGNLAALEDAFFICDRAGVRSRVAVDFFPHVNSTVSLDRLGGTPLLTFSAAPYDEVRLLLKRLIDIAVAVVGLVLLAPFMGIVAILIRLTSPGPIVFRQVRCGLNGRRFLIYKFRSMCENAEALKPAFTSLSTREIASKIPGDPRLTPIGRFLRKFSIDEWPQFWNVLRGEMSIVGPRPAIPGEVERYQCWHRRRLRMKPGLTCLWAVSGRDHVDFETWMKLDMHYIDTWSLALDWKILARTIPRVLTGHGAS